MEYLITNWEWFLLGFFVAEKIVKATPCAWDDILVDGLKAGLERIVGGKKNG